MSTRWYPLYQMGNPRLRVFLPNFWMKMINPAGIDALPNQVHFIVSMGMSKYDVKNYLQTIYKVPVVDVRVTIRMGLTKKAPGKHYIIKEDDFKVAYVTLPKDFEFKFPEIVPADKLEQQEDEEKRNMDSMKEAFKKATARNKLRPDVPGWFA